MSLSFPTALLLDFGGVIVESTRPADWQDAVVDEILAVADAAGHRAAFPDRVRIRQDVIDGDASARLWRNAMSRPHAPRELSHTEFVLDFIAADWSAKAREVLAPAASRLTYAVSDEQEKRVFRPGMDELLRWCAQVGLPVGVVSNAQSGQVHRDILAEAGLDRLLGAQVYSDEHGVRKPNPRIMELGAQALGARLSQCWYVGDHLDRDVLCGRRAGVAVTVLMAVDNLAARPFRPPVEPDLTVADPVELHARLRDLHAAIA